MKMGRPFSSGAYSMTEPDGKPAAAPSDATVDSVPILHPTTSEAIVIGLLLEMLLWCLRHVEYSQ